MHIDDGEHIIYVNGAMRSKDTALGKLMNDFFATEAKDMCYDELSERVRQYKETEEGVDTMCDILDEMRNEAAEEAKYDKSCEIAKKMLEVGKMSMDEIALCSGLSIDKIRELAGNKSA